MSDFAINVKAGTQEISPATPTLPRAAGGSGNFTYSTVGAPAWISVNAQRQVSVNANVPANTKPLLSFLWKATDENNISTYEVIHIFVQQGGGEFVPLQSGVQNNYRGMAWDNSGKRIQYWDDDDWTNAPNYLAAAEDAAITADWLFNRGANVAPFRVGGTAKINNLNADKVDGRDVGDGTGDLLIKSNILALIADWAKAGNAALVPDAKLTGVVDDVTESAGVLTITYKGGLTSQITLPTGGLNTAQVDARISTWARPGTPLSNSGYLIPAAKLPATVVYDADIANLQSQSQVQGLIADWAETGNLTLVPKTKLPSDIIYTTNLATQIDTRINSQIYTWARVNVSMTSSGYLIPAAKISRLPASKVPTGTVIAGAQQPVRAVEASTLNTDPIGTLVITRWDGTSYKVTPPRLGSGGGGGLTQSQVQGLIADWAETGNLTLVPKTKLPGDTVYDADIANFITAADIAGLVTSISQSMGVLTITKQDGTTATVNLPAGSGGGGGLTQSQVQGLIADWAETGNLTRVPTTKLPSTASAGGHTHTTVQTSLSGTTDAATGTSAAALDHAHTVENATAGGTIGSGGSGFTGGPSRQTGSPVLTAADHRHSIPSHDHSFTGTAHGHTTGNAGGHSHAFGSHTHGFSFNHNHNTTSNGSHLHSF